MFHLLDSNPPISRPFPLLPLRYFPWHMLWRFIRWVIIPNNKFFFRWRTWHGFTLHTFHCCFIHGVSRLKVNGSSPSTYLFIISCITTFSTFLEWNTPPFFFNPSMNTTSLFLMILLVFYTNQVICFRAFIISQNTQGMDLDSNLVLFSSRTCAKALQPKTLKWDTSGFMPLHAYWRVLESIAFVGHQFFMYTIVFTASPQNSSSNPCARIMFLAHSMMVLLTRNTVLLWGIGCICLLLNSTFCKKCVKLLRHKFSFVIRL